MKLGYRKKTKRRVVYTCMFGHSEPFNDLRTEEGIDHICFTDDPQLKPLNWQVRLVHDTLIDRARLSKRFKHLPHLYLPEYDESLYHDNRLRLKRPVSQIFALLDRADHPLVNLRHWSRNCVYDAAEAVLALGYDDPARVREQMRFYKSLNYPAGHGLSANAFFSGVTRMPSWRGQTRIGIDRCYVIPKETRSPGTFVRGYTIFSFFHWT